MKLSFVNRLIELAEVDSRVMLLTGDLGYQIFDEFEEKFGERFVNVGVAEAQMMCAAAGLTHVGMRPVTYSIASFATARCFEQIKLAIAYERLPVVIVGAGGGYAYSHSGVTHHAGEDIAIMSSLPGMHVVAPGDCYEVEQLLPQVFDSGAPTYFRIGRGREVCYDLPAPVELGKARLIQDGEGLAIVSTGEVASELVFAVEKLKKMRIEPLAYQFHTVKPLDTDALKTIAEKADKLIVIEEHVTTGGLFSQISAFYAGQEQKPLVTSCSVPDEFVLGSPEKNEFREKYRIDADGITGMVVRADAVEN